MWDKNREPGYMYAGPRCRGPIPQYVCKDNWRDSKEENYEEQIEPERIQLESRANAHSDE